MIQARFIIELEENDGSLIGVHKALLSIISETLGNSGIRCSSIKKKCTTFYFSCIRGKRRCSVNIYESYSIDSDSKIKCYVYCCNTFPFWKRIFNRYSEEDYFSGDLLQDIVKKICVLLRNDSRIADFIIVDKNQWVNLLKNAKESHFFDQEN